MDSIAYLCGNKIDLPSNLNVLRLFEDNVRKNPDKIAVIDKEVKLTYAALNAISCYYASKIPTGADNKPNLIPYLSRGRVEYIIGIISILKTGNAFVPIDVTWPSSRVQKILEKLKPQIILTDNDLSEELVLPYEKLKIKRNNTALVGKSFASIRTEQTQLAYGFYTSGSTGEPKCCLNNHLGLVNRISYMGRELLLQEGDRVLMNSSHVFDSSLWQIFWPLCYGGTVVIPVREGIMDVLSTISLINHYQIVAADFVPSILGLLVDAIDTDPNLQCKLKSLRYLLIGGEEIQRHKIVKLSEYCPQITMINTYGPTEAAIGMVFHFLRDGLPDIIPLGRPIDNTFLMLLKDDGTLCSYGEIGEICIGGLCLGNGYFQEQELTEKSLITSPLQETPTRELYKTGDLGVVEAGKLLYFKGRKDNQVKIGGVRIELEDVDSALNKIHGIALGKVIGVKNEFGDFLLVGFYTSNKSISVNFILDSLKRKLPETYIPSKIFHLAYFPLNHNGKIDVKKLKDAYQNNTIHEFESVNDLQETMVKLEDIVDLFSQYTGCAVSAGDDFFDMGGTSLNAARLALQLSKRAGFPVTSKDIYTCPTPNLFSDFLIKASGIIELPPKGLTEYQYLAVKKIESATEQLHTITLPIGRILKRNNDSYVSQNTLLTGASGFIGIHILCELLNHKGLVFAHVREKSQEEGLKRIKQELDYYKLQLTDEQLLRVVIIPGDIEKKDLGIKDGLETIINDIGSIIHSGAQVNFTQDYYSLEPSNVDSTVDLISAVLKYNPNVVLNFLSTISIFSQSVPALSEQDIPILREGMSGYEVTKYVCEQIISKARMLGLKVNTYRVGEAMPSTDSGVGNRRSLFYNLVESANVLNKYPRISIKTDYSPVNYLAKFIANRSHTVADDWVFHLFNDMNISLKEFISISNEKSELPEEIDYSEFIGQIMEKVDSGNDDPCLVYCLNLPFKSDATAKGCCEELMVAASKLASKKYTLNIEKEMNFVWPQTISTSWKMVEVVQ